MAKFRKKPIVIEAVQFTQEMFDKKVDVPFGVEFTNPEAQKKSGMANPQFYIHTLEGSMQVRVGDWVIKGVQGEVYPCKPDIFEATYEPVTE